MAQPPKDATGAEPALQRAWEVGRSRWPQVDLSADVFIRHLVRLLNNQSKFQLSESTIRTVLMIPDSLTLSEMLDRFRSSKETFAIVINEYAFVVGVITLSDIMVTVMGRWGSPLEADQQTMQRDDGSWLIDGSTPVADMKRVLDLQSLPEELTGKLLTFGF